VANSQTQKDRFREALVKSLIDMVRADLSAAWGGSGVEIVEGHPEFDWDRRPTAAGGTEPRDLSSKPLVVLAPIDGSTGPFAISPAGDEVVRSTLMRLDMAAGSHRAIINLSDTMESILDGSENGTGGFLVKDPDTSSGVCYAYFDDQGRLSTVFSGPGNSADFEGSLPAGKSQFENLKHRASIVVNVEIRKTRGSKVA
jgi:hypothetical protein